MFVSYMNDGRCSPEPPSQQLYYTCFHLRLQVFMTHKRNMIWKPNLHQSISLAEAQKALEAHGCKFSVTSLSIVPHTLGILSTNVTSWINFFELQ